jgi:hypothetical protein
VRYLPSERDILNAAIATSSAPAGSVPAGIEVVPTDATPAVDSNVTEGTVEDGRGSPAAKGK